jgi:hypothetical protein
MAWTAEDRRKYAPAIQEIVRQGMPVPLATTIDTIDPPATVGRSRDWSTLTMFGPCSTWPATAASGGADHFMIE